MSAPKEIVERFVSLALHQRFDRLAEVLDEEFVIVEPDSLPYGGQYKGPEGYARFFSALTAVFEITAFDIRMILSQDEHVVMQADVGFLARESGRTRTVPVLEILTLAGGKIVRSEVYPQDTAALLGLLDH